MQYIEGENMGNIIDYKKLENLTKLLEIEQNPEALESYFGDLDEAKFLDIFEKLKKKVGTNESINYLNLIIDFTGYKLSKELLEELLLDEGLQSVVENARNKKSNDLLTSLLVRTMNDLIEKEEELFETNDENTVEGALYTYEEEKSVFQKYKALKDELERYIYSNNKKEFIDYIDNISSETKDSFMVKAMPKLYSFTCADEPVVNIKKDKNVDDMVEHLREIRDDIDIHNMRLVKKIAKGFASYGLPLADLEQEGRIGLGKAIEKFEVDYGYKFSTYATWWIKQSVMRALANESTTIRFPVHIYEKRVKINKALKILREQDGIEEPSDIEIFEKCKELGYEITMDQIKDRTRLELLENLVSVDKGVGEDEETALIDFISSDNYERLEEYAENREINEITNQILDNLAKVKSTSRRNESVKPPILFKQLIFKDKEQKSIKMILSLNEYNKLVEEMKGENKKTAFTDFLSKYKINPDSLSSYLCINDIKITSQEREVLIFRYRTGLYDSFSEEFLYERNYNGVFFEQSFNNSEILTLEKAGLLFGVTRERIRQIESKVRKKVELCLGKRRYKDTRDFILYMGTKENIYNIFRIIDHNEYVVVLKPNSVVNVDSQGNLIPLGEGKMTVYLKNVINGVTRALNVYVHESLKVSINNYLSERRKILKRSIEKDSQ